MAYEPIKYMPQTINPARMQPAPEPDNPGPWTAVALKLCGVMAVMASVGMIYLVTMCITGK